MQTFLNKSETAGLYETKKGFSLYIRGECITSGVSKERITEKVIGSLDELDRAFVEGGTVNKGINNAYEKFYNEILKKEEVEENDFDEGEEKWTKTFSKKEAEEEALKKIEFKVTESTKEALFREYWSTHVHDEEQKFSSNYESQVASISQMLDEEADSLKTFIIEKLYEKAKANYGALKGFKLVGGSGNVFEIFGRFHGAAKEAKMPDELSGAVIEYVKLGDYNRAISIFTHFSEDYGEKVKTKRNLEEKTNSSVIFGEKFKELGQEAKKLVEENKADYTFPLLQSINDVTHKAFGETGKFEFMHKINEEYGLAVAVWTQMSKFNYQVGNGGIKQYIDNGFYAKDVSESVDGDHNEFLVDGLAELIEAIKSDEALAEDQRRYFVEYLEVAKEILESISFTIDEEEYVTEEFYNEETGEDEDEEVRNDNYGEVINDNFDEVEEKWFERNDEILRAFEDYFEIKFKA